MLSDEEKEEYIEHEILDRLYCLEENDFDKNKVDDGYIKAVLNACKEAKNLIEKQSKEIEELKTQIDEHVYYDLGGRSCGKTELLRHYKKGYDMNNKFWKDKIKAKIEELEKEDRENRMSHNYLVILVLQELLEKE